MFKINPTNQKQPLLKTGNIPDSCKIYKKARFASY